MTYVLQNPYEKKTILHLEDGIRVEIPEFQLRTLLVLLYSKSNIKRKAVTFFNSFFGTKKTYKYWQEKFLHVHQAFKAKVKLEEFEGARISHHV